MRLRRVVGICGAVIGVLLAGFLLRLYQEGGLPQQVLIRALSDTLQRSELRYTSTLSLQASDTALKGDDGTLLVSTSGGLDRARQISESKTTVYAPAAFALPDIFSAGTLQFDWRRASSTSYLRLSAIPPTPVPTASLLDAWIELPSKSKERGSPIAQPLLYYVGSLERPESEDVSHYYEVRLGKAAALILMSNIADSVDIFASELQASSTREQLTSYVVQIIEGIKSTTPDSFPTGTVKIGADGLIRELVLKAPVSIPGLPAAIATMTITIAAEQAYLFGEAPKKTQTLAAAVQLIERERQRPLATAVLNDTTGWVSRLPALTRNDLEVVEGLLVARYTGEAARSTVSAYDRCSNFILTKAAERITKGELTLLAQYPAAATAINASSTRELSMSLLNEYLMPNVIAKVGLDAVIQSEQRSGEFGSTGSAAACKGLPVPARYR